MTRFGWIVVLCFIAGAGILGGAAYVWHQRDSAAALPVDTTATSTPTVDPSELSIYTSGEYGFSFFYPSRSTVSDAFSGSTSPKLAVPWRVQAVGTGTPIVRIALGSDEARVGVSSDPKELAACPTAGPAEVPLSVLDVASTTWHQFSFEKVGTDNERKVTSYRTLHNAQCYAVEVFSPLNASTGTSTAYTIKDTIMSFSFAS